ncbi:MAG: hypothetical protein AB8H79_19645 [Myxococcota bacterium]
MRFSVLVMVLLGGCVDPDLRGGQSGSEVTFGGGCAVFDRMPIGDAEVPVGWDRTVAEFRGILVRQQASLWMNAGSEPAAVSVQLTPSGDAFRLRRKDPDTDDLCADGVELAGVLQLAGAVEGASEIGLIAFEPNLAVVVEVSADTLVFPPVEPPAEGLVYLSGQAEQTEVWLELAEQVGEGRRVIGEIRAD